MAIIIRKLPKASYVVKKALIVKPINTHSTDSPDKTFSLNDTFGIVALINADNPNRLRTIEKYCLKRSLCEKVLELLLPGGGIPP